MAQKNIEYYQCYANKWKKIGLFFPVWNMPHEDIIL